MFTTTQVNGYSYKPTVVSLKLFTRGLQPFKKGYVTRVFLVVFPCFQVSCLYVISLKVLELTTFTAFTTTQTDGCSFKPVVVSQEQFTLDLQLYKKGLCKRCIFGSFSVFLRSTVCMGSPPTFPSKGALETKGLILEAKFGVDP